MLKAFDIGAKPSTKLWRPRKWRGPNGRSVRPEGPKSEARKPRVWSSSKGDVPLPMHQLGGLGVLWAPQRGPARSGGLTFYAYKAAPGVEFGDIKCISVKRYWESEPYEEVHNQMFVGSGVLRGPDLRTPRDRCLWLRAISLHCFAR